ncbi:transposase [Meiothermus sp. QL-1]|uniref:transposase n=1 Tax=Meiothermus sp. QL-1 TaxID=2058095 RepID=UPI003517346B
MRERLMPVFRETCSMRDWTVLGMEVMPDHVHLFLSVPPRWAPSRILRRRGKGGGHLWTPSFYVGSAGNISAQTIQRYIESQRKYQDDDA